MKEKPIKKFGYWICVAKRKGTADIRTKTRGEAKALYHKSYYSDPKKVVVVYRDALELIQRCSGVFTNEWEK